jgi:hypothetical protein
MSRNLRTFFWCIVGSRLGGNWGRGTTIQDAIKSCRGATWSKRPFITILNFKPDTPDDVFANLCNCWTIDDFFGNLVIASDCTEEDHANIKEYFVGYSYINLTEN